MGVGGASSDAMVLALLVRRAPDAIRPAVVSAFITQQKVLSLSAKSLYPLCDLALVRLLGIEEAKP